MPEGSRAASSYLPKQRGAKEAKFPDYTSSLCWGELLNFQDTIEDEFEVTQSGWFGFNVKFSFCGQSCRRKDDAQYWASNAGLLRFVWL